MPIRLNIPNAGILNQYISLALGSVTTSSQFNWVCTFDDTTPTSGTTSGQTTDTTPVTLISYPITSSGVPASGIARKVTFLSVNNADTVANVLTIYINTITGPDSNPQTIVAIPIFTVNLMPGFTLIYDEDGFQVIDANGVYQSGNDAKMFYTQVDNNWVPLPQRTILNANSGIMAVDVPGQGATNLSLIPTGVQPGTYGSSFSPVIITINPYGQIIAVATGNNNQQGISTLGFAETSNNPIYNTTGVPVVTPGGTIDITLKNQVPNTVFAGPPSGPTAQPSFRLMVLQDLPVIPGSSILANTSPSANTPSYILYSSTNQPNTVVSRDTNGNTHANNFESALTNIQVGGTVTLTGASARIQTFAGAGSGTCVLPDATTLQVGHVYEINNNATGTITVQTNGGGALTTMPSGSYVKIILTSGALPAGQWDYHWLMPNSAKYGTAGLNITGNLTVSTLNSYALIVGGNSTQLSSLPLGNSGQLLTSQGPGTNPIWANAPATGGGGSVTSVGLGDKSNVPIYTITNSPITSTGELDITLKTQNSGTLLAGPPSGNPAQPSFRLLVVGDLPITVPASFALLTTTSPGGNLQTVPSGNSGQLLISQGPGVEPVFGNINTGFFTNNIQTLTDSSAVTWNTANGGNASLLLTSGVGATRTLTITNAVPGNYYTIRLIQASSGGQAVTFTGITVKVSGAGSGAVVLSTANNAIDILTFYYDGTTFYCNYGTSYT